ncbi:hypothetical protein [Kitasatospora sp. LaBMicrA B282]|uniref:hypothetical protein n=1 Tax=Kitasatospora sp. LaBMicrA B282 TaxID=3420949 RepID=UPI003D132FD3
MSATPTSTATASATATTSASPTAKPSGTPLPTAPADQQPTVTIRDLPAGPIVPGGAPFEFTAAYRNPGPDNAIVQPMITFGWGDDYLFANQVRIQAQDAKSAWYDTVNTPYTDPSRVGFQYVLNVAGQNPDTAGHFSLAAGQETDFRVRITVAGINTPSDQGWIFGYALSTLVDKDGNPIATGSQTGAQPVSIDHTGAVSQAVAPSQAAAPAATPTAAESAPPAAVVAAVKAGGSGNTPASSNKAAPALAYTGGGDNRVALAIDGAVLLGLGGVLVMTMRRRGNHRG